MNAYGMAGLGQGINQGIQNVTQGMVSAQNEADRRTQVQQQSKIFEQTYKNSQLQQQDYETKLAQTQLQLENMQKEIAKKDTWDVLSGYEQSGDASILNTIKNNKLMDNMLQGYGISGFSNISDLTPEKQQSLGITPEILQDPTKRIVLASTTDGRQVPMDMMKIYATTGFLPKLGEQKLADMTLKSTEYKAKTEQMKFQDMEGYLKNNPGATLADYIAHTKSKENPPAFNQEVDYLRKNYGEDVAQQYIQKKITPSDQTPASVKTDKYKQGQVNTIKQESGVENLYDVSYSKLSPENKTVFDNMVKEDAKNIKPEEYNALSTLESAANKLNVDNLKDTTGIVDATVNEAMDRLGLDLNDKTLVQSANYNLIKNAIIRAAMGSQVTGNELERMTAQLGTEFRADKTVRVKMAETLDNLVAKYEGYKTIAPAFYARAMKDKVENMQKISNYLRNPEGGKPSETSNPKTVKIGQVINGYQYLGGDTNDKKNWKKAE